MCDVVETTRRAARERHGFRGGLAGGDILRSNHGPLFAEVNSSPGLRGIEAATGLDVAGRIIEFIEREGAPNRTRTRGRG